MTPQIFRSLWTNGYALEAALADVASGLFDGIEGPLPADPRQRAAMIERLHGDGIPFIAELVVGGGYVPTERSLAAQLDEFRRLVEAALPAKPLLMTVLAGCDAWPLSAAVDFYGQATAAAHARGAIVSFETHRSRSTFNPWITARLLRQVPGLRLTCDFSHWCCVCERLVLDEEPGLLALCAAHAHHVHARVGYAQGPQVPHPAAPEYADALAAHERWWRVLVTRRGDRGPLTFTPEFGPDGYLQSAPFGGAPAAVLDEVNRWMARRLRERLLKEDVDHVEASAP